MTTVTRSGLTGFFLGKKNRCGGWWVLLQNPGPVRYPVDTPSKNPVDTNDEEDDWNSESGEDDGDGGGSEDEVEEVIQSTSGDGDSAKSILFLPERNEDKENKVGLDLKTPKEYFQSLCLLVLHTLRNR